MTPTQPSPQPPALEHPDTAGTGFRHFHNQLGELRTLLLTMASRAEQAVDMAVDALRSGDGSKAELVVVSDQEVNALEIQIEQVAIELLALQQPMARDLRFLVGAIKLSSDLERIADHAVNIAQSAIRLPDHRIQLMPDPEIEEMTRRSRQMLASAIQAFLDADAAAARAVIQQDDAVDSLHDSVFRIMLTHMLGDARTINTSLELLLVSRNLERIADLATNIAEDAVYLAEGTQIKHAVSDGLRT